ncbi:MAG: RNA polymerase sigma factor [Oligoflexia bacterium]|nr:RNA polymerase sigma factor [Oligoflexia bacterium]
MERETEFLTHCFSDSYYEIRNEMLKWVRRRWHLDRATIEDVVSEGFMRGWQWRERFESIDHAKNWIHKSINNLIISHFRKQRHILYLGELNLNEESDHGKYIAYYFHISANHENQNHTLQSEYRELEKLFDNCKNRQRAKVAVLYYKQGMSVAEIAYALKMKQNTVLSHIYRFRKDAKVLFADA